MITQRTVERPITVYHTPSPTLVPKSYTVEIFILKELTIGEAVQQAHNAVRISVAAYAAAVAAWEDL